MRPTALPLFLAALLLTALLGGCAIGPGYSRPDTAPPQEYRMQPSEIKATVDTAWWELFQDTVMTQLLDEAIVNSTDLQAATARVDEYLGRYQVSRSDFFPKVGAQASGYRGQFSSSGDGSGTRPTTNDFNINANVTWEIDLWGRIRRMNEAARAEVLAAEEGRRGVLLTVVSSVASGYVDLRSMDRQLEVARSTMETRRGAADIFKKRFDAGTVSELEFRQIESEYWAAAVAVPTYERRVAAMENALCALVGRAPGPIPRGKPIDELHPEAVPADIPSALLERRPDVRQAEQLLVAANARIGVAQSLYFPSISLTGLFGVASMQLDNLFAKPATIWDLGGLITAPIFRWGEISGQVKAAEAQEQQALAAYVGAARNAFADANNAITDRVAIATQMEAEGKQIESLREYVRLSRLRYDEGYQSYLEVLDAERSLFNAELSYAQTKAGYANSFINIYKALGGGWIERAGALRPPPPEKAEEKPAEGK